MGGISVLVLFGIFSSIFYFIIAILLIILIYLFLSYIFESIAIVRMCKNLNYKHIFASWVPYYNKYLLGKIAGLKNAGATLGIINAIITFMFIYFQYITNFNTWLLVVFFVLLIISFVLNIVISHKIFNKAFNIYGDIFTVFSILSLGLLRPIFLFIVRNSKKLYE